MKHYAELSNQFETPLSGCYGWGETSDEAIQTTLSALRETVESEYTLHPAADGRIYLHEDGEPSGMWINVVECPIYRFPCTLTGLDAELDNCEEGSYIMESVSVDDPLTEGCDRFVTTDGVLFDCSIDSYQWAEWFRLDHLIEADSEEEYPEDGAE